MVVSSINCNYRTYKYSHVTRGPLLVGFRVGVECLATVWGLF